MAKHELPVGYEKYFDAKFENTDNKINGVDEKVNGVVKEMKKLNGSVADLKIQEIKSAGLRKTFIPDYKKTKKKVNIIGIAVIVLVIMFILLVEESRVVLITVFASLF